MRTDEHGVKCSFSVRSCIASQKDMLIQRVKAIVEFGGGTVGERSNYPGWQYDRDSALRKEIEAVYRDLTGHDGKIEATHGGLECGLFIEKDPRPRRAVHGTGAARCAFGGGEAERRLHGEGLQTRL